MLLSYFLSLCLFLSLSHLLSAIPCQLIQFFWSFIMDLISLSPFRLSSFLHPLDRHHLLSAHPLLLLLLPSPPLFFYFIFLLQFVSTLISESSISGLKVGFDNRACSFSPSPSLDTGSSSDPTMYNFYGNGECYFLFSIICLSILLPPPNSLSIHIY